MNAVRREKAALRKTLLRRRGEFAARADGMGLRLAERFEGAIPVPANASISVYFPINGEIDVGPLTGRLRGAGHPMLLPVTPDDSGPLRFRLWRNDDVLTDGTFGTREPPRDAPAMTPDLLIVPLLGFDRAGRRLGYGGGYYDRTLAALRARQPVLAVGVAFAMQELPRVPDHEADQPLDWIVTENEAIPVCTEA